MRLRLFVLAVVASATVGAAELNVRLKADGESYELAELNEGSRDYFGVYRSPYALLEGVRVHLFPNARFALVEVCDICADDVLATGDYKVDGTTLAMVFSRVKPGSASVRDEFSDLHIVWGSIDKGSYITGFEVFIFPKDQWSRLLAHDQELEYMRRATPYYDWQEILRKYESK